MVYTMWKIVPYILKGELKLPKEAPKMFIFCIILKFSGRCQDTVFLRHECLKYRVQTANIINILTPLV